MNAKRNMPASKKQVIIATLMRPQGDTGVQTHFNVVRRCIERANIPVSLVTPFAMPRSLTYPIFGVRKLIDPMNGMASVWWYEHWHYLMLRAALRQALRTGDAVVYAQCPLSARAALETRLGPEHRVFLVVHFNVSQADEWVSKGKIQSGDRLYRAIQRREEDILPRLDGIVFVSDFVRREVYRRIPAAQRVPAAVVSNFVEKADQAEPSSLRNDLINVGTLEPRKNQQFLLEVLSETKRRGRTYRLSLVGEGPDRTKLQRLAVRLGIADQITFVGRHPHAARLLPFHRAYCHSAVMETQGIALIEALSCGLPVFAAPVGGIPEVLADGVEGRYWPLDDPAKAADILIEVLENQAKYQEMSQGAQTRFATQFDASVVGQRLLNFLYS